MEAPPIVGTCSNLMSVHDYFIYIYMYIFVTVYGKRGHFTQTKKIEFFMLIKSYNLSELSAKILEGKTWTRRETDS